MGGFRPGLDPLSKNSKNEDFQELFRERKEQMFAIASLLREKFPNVPFTTKEAFDYISDIAKSRNNPDSYLKKFVTSIYKFRNYMRDIESITDCNLNSTYNTKTKTSTYYFTDTQKIPLIKTKM